MTPPRWCKFLQALLLRHPQEQELCGQPPTPAAASACRDMQELRCFKYRELLKLCTLVEAGSGHSIDSDTGKLVCGILDSSPSALPPRQILQQGDWLTERVLHLQSELAVHIVRHAMALHFVEQLQPCVLALGKLGAEELNFSSDVDIIFLAPDCADFPGSESEYKEWFDHTCRQLVVVVRELERHTEEGFLYRVDLRLRPWGDSGPILVALDAMENYYAAKADAWERLAMLRARPIAGDINLGQTLLQNLHSFLYPRNLSMDQLQPLFAIKQRMQDKRKRSGAWDVKTGAGGIRDIEFFVHLMQWLHGARHSGLHTTRTLALLHQLGELGVIDKSSAAAAMDSYLVLRALENALQMQGERQVHHLPEDQDAVAALAAMLLPQEAAPQQQFAKRLAQAKMVAAELFAGLLPENEHSADRSNGQDNGAAALTVWDVDSSNNSMQLWRDMQAQQAGSDDGGEQHSVLLRSIFGASWYCTRYLFQRGGSDLPPLYMDSPEAMSLRTASPKDMSQLRSMYSETTLRILSWDLRTSPEQQDLEHRLSLLARQCFRQVVKLLQQQYPVLQGLVVMAMGRLAVSEMNYGSDLDLVFLSTGTDSDLTEFRAAIVVLLRECQLPTEVGRLYQIDTRLKPYGSGGTLVASLESFHKYHTATRETWERQAMTRCQVLCGPDDSARKLLA
ncbi:MAG: hypothetical protein ACNYPG_05040, partial [Candidatus Porifericomitaceae bacterium WSBS_2022_MAG_OTU9]